MPDLEQVHPTKRLIGPGGAVVDIDVEMVPLIRRLWDLGLETRGCCQDFGESILHNGHRTTSDDDRQRFANFFAGQAWLKMPIGDAAHLLSVISSQPKFAHRLRHWTHPDAWMNIVCIHPSKHGTIKLDRSAQLHFPRIQIPDLIEALQAAAPRKRNLDDR